MADTALILAGGRSSRFGSDKAFVNFGELSLIEHIIKQLEPLFSEIIISANDTDAYRQLGLQISEDILSGYGPLAGIHSGLKASAHNYVFVTACDMPFVSTQLIKTMRDIISDNAPPAVVAERNGFIEPFHGFYSKQLTPLIEQAAAGAEPMGIFAFLKKITPSVIECVDERPFMNINTPQDIKKISPCGL